MNISKKTGYGLLIVSALISLVQSVMYFLQMPAALLGNIAFISFGIGVLLLASLAKADKQLMLFSLAALALALAGIMPVIGRLGCLAWPVMGFYAMRIKRCEAAAVTVIIAGGAMLLLSFFPLGAAVGSVASCVFVLMQLWFAYSMFKSEENSSQ